MPAGDDEDTAASIAGTDEMNLVAEVIIREHQVTQVIKNLLDGEFVGIGKLQHTVRAGQINEAGL